MTLKEIKDAIEQYALNTNIEDALEGLSKIKAIVQDLQADLEEQMAEEEAEEEESWFEDDEEEEEE